MCSSRQAIRFKGDMMKMSTAYAEKAANKPPGFILFALMIIAAVLIIITAVGDGMTNTVNAVNVYKRATLTARCGLDETTYMQLAPLAKIAVEQQCGVLAEVQP